MVICLEPCFEKFSFLRKDQSSDSDKSDSEKEEKSSDDEIPAEEMHPLATVTKIDPDEIPDIPRNNFLYRGGGTGKNENKDKDRDNDQQRRKRKARIRGVTKSGRVIKGRGVFVSELRS